MKKAINKTERHHIITELVVQAAGKKAQEIFNDLATVRKEVATLLLLNWEDHFPGISDKDRLELLRSGGAIRLSFRPYVYTGKENTNKGNFAELAWCNSGSDTEKERIATFACRIFRNASGTTGVTSNGVSTGWGSKLYISSTYVDIIAGNQPNAVYQDGDCVPASFGHSEELLNNALVKLNKKVMALLEELKVLIYSVEDAYQTLSAALAPVKTAQALAELMPESVKFFPPSLTYVKPTKEIADPKAINDIRAKLKKGLPI